MRGGSVTSAPAGTAPGLHGGVVEAGEGKGDDREEEVRRGGGRVEGVESGRRGRCRRL